MVSIKLIGEICDKILHILFILLPLICGLTESFILADNTSARGKCGPWVYECIFLLCVFHFIMFIIKSCVYYFDHTEYTQLSQSILLNEEVNRIRDQVTKKYMYSYLIIALAYVSVSAWPLAIYLFIEPECKSQYTKNYPNLWHMIYANMLIFILYVYVIFMIAVSYLCLKCIACYNRNQSVVRSRSF